ncbi:MAG: SdrD B-like domain-containing protein [Caldilineaceae bacterium]
MFFAAIGGAVLGMLLTLLVLALVNGGTLSFSGPRISALEDYVARVDENVGAISANVNLVSEQAASLQQQLGSVETALRNELETQNGDISTLNSSVATLQVTRQQFGHFMDALDTALADMQAMDPALANVAPAAEEPGAEAAPAAAAPAEEAPATEAAAAVEPAAEPVAVAMPQIVQSADVAADAIAAFLFVDENGDGLLSEGETNLIGLPVSLHDSSGEVITTQESSDAGVLFADLTAGEYQLSVDDMGYSLLSEATATVDVAANATEGTIVYIPVAAE